MPATAGKKSGFDSKILREFPRVGRYRVRLVENARAQGKPGVLDIREFLETESFNGFTRRGIRLYTRREAAELGEAIKQVLEDAALPEQAVGAKE
jgi:hypothetical protein